MDTVAISIDLPEEAVRELDALAARKHQSRAATIPYDDQELTLEEKAGIAEGLAQVERGETVPWETVKCKLIARNP